MDYSFSGRGTFELVVVLYSSFIYYKCCEHSNVHFFIEHLCADYYSLEIGN